MAEVEAAPEGPAWMLALEKKRQRVHRLAHEVGAGSPCLHCQDDCPGLDLHFWRKICRNCKCKKEDHDVIDDYGAEQFEILLGSGHSTNRPNKAFLEMLEKHTSAGFKNKMKSFAFDWVPPDVSPVIAAEYMQSLPTNKLPISGSDGALYRRQQLERQLPLHDLDASQCHQLSDAEVENLKKYLKNLKDNVVGQGRVTKLHIPTSNSLDSLSKIGSFNSIPKPFQSTSGNSVPAGQPPEFAIGGHINSGHPVHLKPPSAFWPKSLSPEPPRSMSPMSSDAPLPSVADRGAAFGVTLSPAKGSRPVPKPAVAASGLSEGSVNANQGAQLSPSGMKGSNRASAHLVKDQAAASLSKSVNVPGSMWVPAECEECSKLAVDGQLVSHRVCTHISKSTDLPQMLQSSKCAECLTKVVDGHLVSDQICTHISKSTDLPKLLQQSKCAECLTKSVDGLLVSDKICPHILSSTDLPQLLQPSKCIECARKNVYGQVNREPVCTHGSRPQQVVERDQPSACVQCLNVGLDGKQFTDQICSHIAVSEDYPHSKLFPGRLESKCTECTNKGLDGQIVQSPVCTHLNQSTDTPHKVFPGYVGGFETKKKATASEMGAFDSPHELFPNSQQSKLSPLGELGYIKSVDDETFGPTPKEFRGPSPLPPLGQHSNVSDLLKPRPLDGGKASPVPNYVGGNHRLTAYPDQSVPSPLNDNDIGHLSRNKSPTSMMSSAAAPHMMALYAHNALNNPASLDPQDTLSPYVASMSIDDGSQPGAIIDAARHQPEGSDSALDLKLHCAECRENIFPGEVVVFADRAGPEVVWHPKCFVCNVCQELLVDLVYFFNKDRVYCGRHYAEILDIPRCSACDELIFVKEYTVAEGQAFHVKHFCCFECDEPLGGKQYVPKDGQPICLPCYGRKYGKQCVTCKLVIGAKDQGVTWKDVHWHATPECFRCNFCHKSLLGGRFAVKDQRPFCSKECMQGDASANHQKVSAV